MKKYVKETLSLVLLALLPTFVFAQGGREKAHGKNETFVFVDSLGRERILPKELTRISPSGNVAQVQLYSIANDLLVGNAADYSPGARKYLKEYNANLPTLGAFYGKKANLNKEALISCSPQLVVDIGQIKGSPQDMASDLDNLESQINIPVVFVESRLEKTPDSYRILGTLLNRKKEGEELAHYAQEAINTAKKNRKRIEKPVTIYYSKSRDGLNAVPTGSFHAEVLELVGAQNVIPPQKGKGANPISLEQLFMANPEVILLSSAEAYDHVRTDKTWAKLSAVKNKRVYLLPSLPYFWLDSPPSVNRIIGIYYIGALLYPEIYADINLEDKIIQYYKLFYKYDMSDAEARVFTDRL